MNSIFKQYHRGDIQRGNWRSKEQVFLRSLNKWTNESAECPGFLKENQIFTSSISNISSGPKDPVHICTQTNSLYNKMSILQITAPYVQCVYLVWAGRFLHHCGTTERKISYQLGTFYSKSIINNITLKVLYFAMYIWKYCSIQTCTVQHTDLTFRHFTSDYVPMHLDIKGTVSQKLTPVLL